MGKKLFGHLNPQYKPNLEQYRTFEWLYQKYCIEELSLSSIAKIVNVDIKCISKWMNKVDIPRRQSGARFGKNNHHFKGYCFDSRGYKLIYSPNHPNKDNRNYVFEHRLVVEKYLNRYLTREETIHHIDENKLNNKLSNLYLFSQHHQHDRYHQKLRKDKSFQPITKSNLSRFKF
jgi:hypothetical protein